MEKKSEKSKKFTKILLTEKKSEKSKKLTRILLTEKRSEKSKKFGTTPLDLPAPSAISGDPPQICTGSRVRAPKSRRHVGDPAASFQASARI